jgi:hypothetical protein
MYRHRERAAYKKYVKGMSSKARARAELLSSAFILGVRWDRHRGYRAEGSQGCFPHRGSAREFPDQRRQADTAPRQTSPACHPAVRLPARWSSLPVQSSHAAGPVASARNWWWELEAQFVPRVSLAPAGPVRPPLPSSPSAHTRNRTKVLSACGETGRTGRGSPLNRTSFRTCGIVSARSDPLAASAAARSG